MYSGTPFMRQILEGGLLLRGKNQYFHVTIYIAM